MTLLITFMRKWLCLNCGKDWWERSNQPDCPFCKSKNVIEIEG